MMFGRRYDDPYMSLIEVRKIITEYGGKEADLDNLRKTFKRIDKNCKIRQIAENEGFMIKPRMLYKYTSKEHADDLLDKEMLYCGTIGDYRKGEKGDQKEMTLWSITDLITEGNEDMVDMLNRMLKEEGKPEFNPSQIMEEIDDKLVKKHMSCMSSSPYIEKMWDWCGNEDGICIPINVKGLPYYKAIYGDEKDDFSDEKEEMLIVLMEAFYGNVNKKKIRELCDRMKAVTYISICRKTTDWDYQEEYRMFVEDKDLQIIEGKSYFPVKGRVKKPITYEDYLKNESKS